MSDKKTLQINTMDEQAYLKAAARGKVHSDQLYIVDDDSAHRTVVPSYDLLGAKSGQALEKAEKYARSLSCQISALGPGLIGLVREGEIVSQVSAAEFLKDLVLSSAEAGFEGDALQLTFRIKNVIDGVGLSGQTITASCDLSIQPRIDEVSNALEDLAEKCLHLSGGTVEWLSVPSLSAGKLTLAESHQLSDLNVSIGDLSAQLGMDGYYRKDETSSDAEISGEFENLRGEIDTAKNRLLSDIGELSGAIDQVSADVLGACEDLSGAIYSVSAEIFGAIDQVSVDLQNETSARISGDSELNQKLVKLDRKLSAEIYDAKNYGLSDSFEDQDDGDPALAEEVIGSFRAGKNAIVKFGGYSVLVNAVVDKSPTGLSGFCGLVATAETAGEGFKLDQIRAAFFSDGQRLSCRLLRENSDVDGRISDAKTELSGFVQEVSSQICAGYSQADSGILGSLFGLSGQVSSFSNDWKTGVDNDISCLQLSAEALTPAFFDAQTYGLSDELAPLLSADDTRLVEEVVSAFNAGKNAIIRFGGYNVLVNAIVNKTPAGTAEKGFSGVLTTAKGASEGVSGIEQIRAIFYTWNGSTIMQTMSENDMVSAAAQTALETAVASAKSYTDSVGVSVMAETSAYTDSVGAGAAASAVISAKTYADQISAAAEGYADSVGVSAISYTNEVSSGIMRYAWSIADRLSDYVETKYVIDDFSVSNKIITEKHLNGKLSSFDKALRFMGTVQGDPPTELSSESFLSNYNPGDILINSSSGREWILVPDPKRWEIIGDQNNMATKAELEYNVSALNAGKIAADGFGFSYDDDAKALCIAYKTNGEPSSISAGISGVVAGTLTSCSLDGSELVFDRIGNNAISVELSGYVARTAEAAADGLLGKIESALSDISQLQNVAGCPDPNSIELSAVVSAAVKMSQMLSALYTACRKESEEGEVAGGAAIRA